MALDDKTVKIVLDEETCRPTGTTSFLDLPTPPTKRHP